MVHPLRHQDNSLTCQSPLSHLGTWGQTLRREAKEHKRPCSWHKKPLGLMVWTGKSSYSQLKDRVGCYNTEFEIKLWATLQNTDLRLAWKQERWCSMWSEGTIHRIWPFFHVPATWSISMPWIARVLFTSWTTKVLKKVGPHRGNPADRPCLLARWSRVENSGKGNPLRARRPHVYQDW